MRFLLSLLFDHVIYGRIPGNTHGSVEPVSHDPLGCRVTCFVERSCVAYTLC